MTEELGRAWDARQIGPCCCSTCGAFFMRMDDRDYHSKFCHPKRGPDGHWIWYRYNRRTRSVEVAGPTAS